MPCICCYVLEGSRLLFADEINKKRFLDVMLAAQKKNSWPVYAFCVTDYEAYFVSEVTDENALSECVKEVAGIFLSVYEGFPDRRRRLKLIRTERIGSREELARRCRAVHRLPLMLGYVHRIGDYWWSSYKTYTQIYFWPAVNCSIFLHYFSQDPDRALKDFKKYHVRKSEDTFLKNI